MGKYINRIHNKEPSIKIKGEYSDKNDLIDFSTEIQIDDINTRTRTILCNELYELLAFYFNELAITYKNTDKSLSVEFCEEALSYVFEKDLKSNKDQVYDWEKFFKLKRCYTKGSLLYSLGFDRIRL